MCIKHAAVWDGASNVTTQNNRCKDTSFQSFSVSKKNQNDLATTNNNSSCPSPGQSEKIKSNFYFHTSSWCIKRFYEGLTPQRHQKPQRSVEIKI